MQAAEARDSFRIFKRQRIRRQSVITSPTAPYKPHGRSGSLAGKRTAAAGQDMTDLRKGLLEQPGVSHEFLLEKTKLEDERQADVDALAPIQNKAPERALLTPAQKHSNLFDNHSVNLLQESVLAAVEEILNVCRSREVADGSYVPFCTFACDLAR